MWQASCFFSSSICARLTVSHVTAVSGFSFNSWQSKKANKDIYRNVEIFLLKISLLIRPTVIIHFKCSVALLSPFFCFVLWKLIFHPLFVVLIFPKVPTSLFLFVQLQFIKHSWRCRNVLFHYCAINHFSRSFSPAACGHPRPSTPNSISLVWQLLSRKMAVTASATHTEKYMKGRGKLNDYHLNAHAELQ